MKVALFTDSDVFAGTERHIAALGSALKEQAVEVSVACPTPSPLATAACDGGLPVISIQKAGTLDRPAIKKLRTLLRQGELDLIHAHNGRTALSAAIAVRTAGLGRCLMTQHFLHPNHTTKTGPARLLSNLAHGWVNRNLDHVIAISTAVRDASISRGDVSADRITVVQNGLTDLQLDAMPSREQLRSDLKIADDEVLIICVARLDPEKNVRSLVAAMTDLLTRRPDAKLRCAIVGSGVEAELIQQLINQKGLGNQIHMLGYRTDAQALMRAADILVLPSIAEPFGLVLLEAMAVGTVVIATRVGGPMEIVHDSITGLLVPPGDTIALAAAIAKLAQDPQFRASLGRAGRQRFIEHYTARRMAAETASLYRRLVNPHTVPDPIPVARVAAQVH